MQSRFHTTSVKLGHCRDVRRMIALAPNVLQNYFHDQNEQ